MDVIATPSRHPALTSVLVAAICLSALLLTSPLLPMVWDEGNAILRAEKIPHEWQYTTQAEGHPAFYGMLIAAGQRLAPAWLRPLDAARFGPMLLFSVAAAAMFYRIGRDYSLAAAAGAVAALVLLPRMFAHAHFASFDGPLTSCWILTWAAFVPAWRRREMAEGGGRRAECATAYRLLPTGHGALPPVYSPAANCLLPTAYCFLWGLALGATFSCKATGWLAVLPFVGWTILYWDRQGLKTLCVGVPVALCTFFALNPPLWHDPLRGWATFFHLNLHRAAQPGLNISTQFLGQMYNLDYPLPWYNTLVWTAVAVPVGTLLLLLVGVVVVCRQRRDDRPGILLLANWLLLLIVRALPGTPPHDGIRLFLPSFAFLAALAGVGCGAVLGWARTRWPEGARNRRLTLIAVLLLYAGSASSLYWYAPQWLSHYNLLIGGLPGASALGMEPTYYWDGLDQSVLDWLHAHTAEDEKIAFAAISPENLQLMQRWRMLLRETSDDAPGHFRWYVLQRRPSGLQPADLWLIEHARPAYRKTIRTTGFGPWRLSVPLVEVYCYSDYLRAAAQAVAAGG